MSEHPSQLPELERRSIWPMFMAGILMIAFFAGAGWWLRAAISSGSPEEELRAETRRENLRTLVETNEQELTTYGWVDKAKGVVRIPLDQAMELEIAALNEQKPRAAYPVATPVPEVGTPATTATDETTAEPAPEEAESDATEIEEAAATSDAEETPIDRVQGGNDEPAAGGRQADPAATPEPTPKTEGVQ